MKYAQIHTLVTDMGNGARVCSSCYHNLDNGDPFANVPSICPGCGSSFGMSPEECKEYIKKNAVPVESWYDTEVVDDCRIYKGKKTGEVLRRRYFSTCEEDKIKAAMLLLLETEWGFSVGVIGPAFTEKDCLKKDSKLEIRRTGYGAGPTGPEDIWHIYYNGEKLSSHDNPHDAIKEFLRVREEKELGEDMADRKFCGHATPYSHWAELEPLDDDHPEFHVG